MIDLAALASQLRAKGSPLSLAAGDTTLPAELRTFLASVPGGSLTLAVQADGISLDGQTLTVTGPASGTWPVQGYADVTVTLTTATVTITNAAGTSTVTGRAAGSLPVAGHSVTAALASAMIQSVQAWTLTLGGAASGLRASDLLMLGQGANFAGPAVPAGLDALDTAVTVEPAGLVLTFFPGTTFDPWLQVALQVPGARWTVIEQILEFDGIEIAMFLAPRSYSVALTSYLVIDTISVAVTVGMSADSHWIATVRPKDGTAFPGLVALAGWLCGAGSGVPGQAAGGFQASGFDLAAFDLAISSVRAGFDISHGSLDFVEVTSVLTIRALQLDIAVRLPDLTIQGGLHGSQPLNVAAVLASFGLATDGVPAGLTVSEADFRAQPRRGTFAVDLILDDLWQAGPVALEQVAVSVSRDSVGQFTGWISGYLTVGASTRLTMSAGYDGPPTGWSFAGGTLGDDGLPIGELLALLSAKFGIENVPEALSSLTLKNLMLAYQTGTGTFTFTCEGDFTIATTPVALAIDVHLTGAGSSYSAEYHGRLSVGNLVFDVTFDTEPGGQTFVASYRNNGAATTVSLHDLVASLSPAAAAAVPADLSIGLTDAKFAYVKPTGATEGVFALGLDLSAKVGLSDLPLVGAELPPDASVAISNLQILYSSATIDSTAMVTANTLLAANGVIPFPASLAAGVAFTADLQAGTDHLAISLGVPTGQAIAVRPAVAARTDAAPAPVSQPVGHWFDVSKSFGPVSISRIGVQYQDSALFLLIDASLGLAALTVGLDGLGLGSPLGRFELRPHLDGLSISFSDGPVSIAGGFLVVSAPSPGVTDEYAGELTIAFESYLISGFGAYAKVSGSPSFFVFAEVDGEFGGPPAFFVTGLMGGVGYNWALSLPPPDQVYTFPFVAGLGNPSFFGGTKPTPVQVLSVLSGNGGQTAWVTPAKGQNWLAAGVQFRSFELITGRALLVAEFGTEFELALLGLATVALPQGATDDAYAYAELQLEVVLKPADGMFSAIASLTPNSYLLTKQCHLTGGFAFCLWFGQSPHAGDFVLTLGGYHPAFTPKPWYPSVPPLGFHWAVDNSLVIKGGAYFAITPTAVMAGASLEVLFESGDLKAWLIAYANIMIRWRPFYLTAEIGISIGVSYRLNLEFTSVVLAVQLGATLELWGPPTGGLVHIDWYILSFSIAFGAAPASGGDLTLDWPGFQELLPSASTLAPVKAAAARAAVAAAPADDSHPAIVSLTVSRGLRSTDSTTGDWIVRADELILTATSAIPVTSILLGKQVPLPAGTPATIDIRPMGATGVSSALTITISGVDLTSWPGPSVQSSAQPEALWGSPIPDSASPAPAANLIPGLVTGLSFAPPPAAAGAAAGPVDPGSLISPLGLGELPLRPASQGDPIAEPVADPGSIQAIAAGVASLASVRAQQALVSVLADYQAGPPTSAPLTGLGDEAGAIFSQPPMRTA